MALKPAKEFPITGEPEAKAETPVGGWDKSKISSVNPTGAHGNKAWWVANPNASTVVGYQSHPDESPWSEEELAHFTEEERKDALVAKAAAESYEGAPWRKHTRPISPTAESEFRARALEADALQSLPELHPEPVDELDAPAGSIEGSVEAPRSESATPATKAVGTELLMQSTLPDQTAEGKAATALMELGDLYKKSAEAEADALTVKFGERQETKAEANLRVQLMQRERMQVAADKYEDDYADSNLTMNYPGASLFEIKKWQGDLERQATIESGDFLASPQQAQEARRKAAVAKRNLANAESIDTDRAFGNVTSKVLAALSIGLGSWASTKGGGRNTALDMYNQAITTDIAAQKEMFAHKRGAVGRTRSQYQFFMDRLKDGKAAELSVAAAGWGVAAQEFNKTAALSKNMALAQKAYAASAEAEARSMKYKQAALKRAQEVAGMSYTGVKGIRYTGGKIGRDITEHETKLLFDTIRPTIGAKSAGRQYKQAFEKAMGVKGEAAQSGALLARENFIAALGTLFEKGVLQKFEREELEKILPGQSTWAEKTWRSVTTQDRVNAAVDRLNQILEDRVDLLVEEMEFFEFDRSTKIPEKRKGRRTSTQAAQEYLAGKKTGG